MDPGRSFPGIGRRQRVDARGALRRIAQGTNKGQNHRTAHDDSSYFLKHVLFTHKHRIVPLGAALISALALR